MERPLDQVVRKNTRQCDKKRRQWESQIKSYYRIYPEDVARAYNKQNKMCAICDRMLFLGKETHIDHCHRTGKFRGLLCSGCNSAMSRIDMGHGEKMIKYAERGRIDSCP